MTFFSDLSTLLEKFDNWGFRYHLAKIEATRRTGEDGKQYIRFPISKLGESCPPAPPQ
jgi:hypothetical protein